MWCYLAQISSSCLNPAIYAFFSPEFSKLVFKFCCRCYTGCGCTRSCCRSHVNQVQPTMWMATKRLTNSFRLGPHHAQRIWKRWRHSENPSNIRDITGLSWRHRFRKAFPSTRKWKAIVFRSLRFEKRFWQAPFSWRISVDGRPNCKNKGAFPYFSVMVWTLPQSAVKYIYINFSKQPPHKRTPWVDLFCSSVIATVVVLLGVG